MELRRKISDRELKLIMLFATLILCIISYQFGYIKYQQKTARLRTENSNIRIQVEEMNRKKANKAEILRKTEENKAKAELLIGEFPLGLEQEGTTLLFRALREDSGWKLSHISYEDISVFYTREAPAAKSAAGGTAAEPSEKTGRDSKGITGYKRAVTISYQTTYQGLKRGIAFLTGHKNRMSMTSLTAAFDPTTGNLTGSMTLMLYAVDGPDREVQEELLPKIRYGRENIFGTFELPHKEGEGEAVWSVE